MFAFDVDIDGTLCGPGRSIAPASLPDVASRDLPVLTDAKAASPTQTDRKQSLLMSMSAIIASRNVTKMNALPCIRISVRFFYQKSVACRLPCGSQNLEGYCRKL